MSFRAFAAHAGLALNNIPLSGCATLFIHTAGMALMSGVRNVPSTFYPVSPTSCVSRAGEGFTRSET